MVDFSVALGDAFFVKAVSGGILPLSDRGGTADQGFWKGMRENRRIFRRKSVFRLFFHAAVPYFPYSTINPMNCQVLIL
ncbi:MAG: hypothetical protein ACI3XR_02590 [Eubacteriales bacterium]